MKPDVLIGYRGTLAETIEGMQVHDGWQPPACRLAVQCGQEEASMRVLLLATLSAVIAPALGCGGGVEIADASRLVDAGSDSAWGALVDAGAQCRRPENLWHGAGACQVGRRFLECTYPNGIACEGGLSISMSEGVDMDCLSDLPASCEGCASTSGQSVCKGLCAPDEYAVTCGGIPIPPPPDGPPATSVVFEEPPDGCRASPVYTSEFTTLCCPCQ